MKEVKYMANAIAINKSQKLVGNRAENDQTVFGQKIGLITTMFGCWHKNISRPFVNGKTGYRSCLQCGARKHFNPETLQTDKKFYFPPIAKNARV